MEDKLDNSIKSLRIDEVIYCKYSLRYYDRPSQTVLDYLVYKLDERIATIRDEKINKILNTK